MRVLDLAPAAAEVARLLAGTGEEQLGAPTPCGGTPVAALVDHLAGVCAHLARGAAPSRCPDAGPGVVSDVGPDAGRAGPAGRGVLPIRLTGLVRAWGSRAAWEGVVEVGGTPVAAEVLGALALAELVVHGWDLARGTGQPFACDPASACAVLVLATAAARRGTAPGAPGLFGPVVPVPP